MILEKPGDSPKIWFARKSNLMNTCSQGSCIILLLCSQGIHIYDYMQELRVGQTKPNTQYNYLLTRQKTITNENSQIIPHMSLISPKGKTIREPKRIL